MSSHLPPETKPYDPSIEQNVILLETAVAKVEYDKGCWGFKYQVFSRTARGEPWVHVAEAATEEEAIAITKDRDRMTPGYIAETEVERRRRVAAEKLEADEAEPAHIPPPEPTPMSEASIEELATKIAELQADGIPLTNAEAEVRPAGRGKRTKH